MCMVGLTGCSQTKSFFGGGTAKTVETVTSSDIYIPIEKLRTLNPVISKDEDAYYINKLIYDGLFEFNENLEVIPVLATSYEYGNQGGSVTINLREGINWHDGSSFTAEDVKFSIEAYLSAPGNTIYSSYVNNIKSVTIKDSYTVVVTFSNNTNVGIENFVFPIIPKHQFRTIGETQKLDANFIPVGTGNYEVEKYDLYSELILIANKNSNHGVVAKNRLLFQVMSNKKDALNLIDMNGVSLTFSKQIDRDTGYSKKDVKVTSFASNEIELIGFNLSKKTFQDKRVRQAIAHVIDAKTIIDTGYFQSGMTNDNLYYPNYLGINSKGSAYSYDVDKAGELLTKAGYIDRDGDGKVENIDNDKISVNILVNANDPSRIVAAQTIKTGLDKLPIDSTVVVKEWEDYNSALNSGDFDIFVGGFKIKETYDLRFMLHSSYANKIGYSNPKLDVLLDKMQSGISNEEKKETYQKIKDILTDELPYYCLLYKTYGAIAPNSFKGKLNPMFHDYYRNSEEWNCVYEKSIEKKE